MLVTFKTNAYSDITMFGSAAVPLLKLMGQSGNVPGAIMADEVADALLKLKAGLTAMTDESDEQSLAEPDKPIDDEDSEPVIGLDKRAGPLIELLEAAVASGENVLWNA